MNPTRFASGRKSGKIFEVKGALGSLIFNLEDMFRLWYFDSREPKHMQGLRAASPIHPVATKCEAL